jgi:hypothetical protein
VKKRLRRIGLAAALTLAAAVAQAEGKGEAVLTISGAEHRFALSAKQSDWSGSPRFASVSMSLVPSEDAARKKFIFFKLGFEISGKATRAPEARFMRRDGSRRETLFAKGKPKGGGLTVKIESLEGKGTLLKISGKFDSKMGPSKNFGRNIDLDAAIPVMGTFSVTLERLKR